MSSIQFSRAASFTVATLALVGCFIASGVPVPLYNLYRVENGITDADLALTTVFYLLCTALSLLFFGRLSNHLGRRTVVFGAVLTALAGCLVFMQVQSLPVLILGRALQGIACGAASSAAGAMAIDFSPRSRLRWLPSVVTSNLPIFAIPVGAIASGVLVEYFPHPRILSFAIMASILAIVAVLIPFCPETADRKPGALRSLIPRVEIPQGAGRAVFATGAGLLATWSWGGFFQAFSPGLTSDYLGTSNALAIAVVFASFTILSPLGGAASARIRAVPSLRLGLVLFSISVVLIAVTLHAGSILWLLLAALVAGFFNGQSNNSGMRAVFEYVTPSGRAGTLATIYLISYLCSAVPGLFAGELSRHLPIPHIASLYAGLAIFGTLVALIVARPKATK
ncbi:MFS transporter [Gulosibacter chungangensis]|uniref:MFS transporter n=1 Tax=Gulosibacter chungangensis TaxID=979746 RepID=A0A7J5BAY3_9MICO|nr:MFS transporter [Gulosibacter chungangensis]KAB1642177.1 MFS transporter [Gulosibacter chungangensis]